MLTLVEAMDRQEVIDIEGFKLGYSIEGTGTPTLVIGSSIYYPRTFLGDIRNHLKLIFIDHRGFVPPPRELTTNDFSLDVLLNDIDQVRAELQLDQFVIMGHSGHAFLALEYAKKYPQYVSQVVMIGVSPDYSEATHEATSAFFEEMATQDRKESLMESMALHPARLAAYPEKRFIAYCLSAGPKSWYNYRFDATDLWDGVYTNMQIIDYVWGVIFRDIDITKGLATFDKPVLLVLGKYDFLTGPPTLWGNVQNQFKNLTIHIFEKSSHTPQFEQPELFNEVLIDWLNR